MIFRIDGEIAEMLALTPIIREWTRRNGNKVLVETKTPEIFNGNPDVLMAGDGNVMARDSYYDMNQVRWRKLGISVEEIYAEMIFGDKNLRSWKPEMYVSDDTMKQAVSRLPDKKPVAAIFFEDKVIGKDSSQGAIDSVGEAGYEIVNLDSFESYGLKYAAISNVDLFVGSDGDVSAIALATDTPAIVCYSYRSPHYFPPFRRGIPYTALVPDRVVCEHAPVCHSRHSFSQYASLYSQECVLEEKFACMTRNLKDDVSKAISRMRDKA